MTAPPTDGTAGFVLLETIVAFLVLVVTLTAAIATISQASLSIRRAAEADLAARAAREIAAIHLPSIAGAGAMAGEVRDAPWRIEADLLEDSGPAPLYAVTIIVRPGVGAGEYTFRSFAVVTAPDPAR